MDDDPLITDEEQNHLYDFVKDEPCTDWDDYEGLRKHSHPLHHLKCALKYLIEARREFAANKDYYEGENSQIADAERLALKFFTRSQKTEQPDTFISEYLQSIQALTYPDLKYEVVDGRVVDETTTCPIDFYEEYRRAFDDFLHDVSFLKVAAGFDELQKRFYELHNEVRRLLRQGMLRGSNTLPDDKWNSLLGGLYAGVQCVTLTLGTYEALLDKLYAQNKIIISADEAKVLRNKQRAEIRKKQLDRLLRWARDQYMKRMGHTDQYMIRKVLEEIPGGYASEGSLKKVFIDYKKCNPEEFEEDKRPRTRGYKIL